MIQMLINKIKLFCSSGLQEDSIYIGYLAVAFEKHFVNIKSELYDLLNSFMKKILELTLNDKKPNIKKTFIQNLFIFCRKAIIVVFKKFRQERMKS